MPARSKFTEPVKKAILDALRIGATMEMASYVAGVNPSQTTRWMAKGREEESGAFHDFVMAVEQARAETPLRALGVIYREIPNNAALALKVVERKVKGWAPPTADKEPPQQPIRIVLSLSSQMPSALPSSVIEVLEQDSQPESA